MKSVIHQAFGDVINADVGVLADLADVDDAFVGDTTARAAIQHGKMFVETRRHIVCGNDCNRN